METIKSKINHHDWVQAYYSELMITKAPGANPTANELMEVSEQAAISHAESDDPRVVRRLTDNLSHPYGAMWAHGELNGQIYYEWVYAIERPKAAEQVARTLARMRESSLMSRPNTQ